jgi:hypothetical protein
MTATRGSARREAGLLAVAHTAGRRPPVAAPRGALRPLPAVRRDSQSLHVSQRWRPARPRIVSGPDGPPPSAHPQARAAHLPSHRPSPAGPDPT